MIAFICLFFPAVLSVWAYEALTRTELKGKKWVYRFCGSTLIINFICFAIKSYVLATAGYPLYELATDMLPGTAVKYMIMAAPAAIILVVVEVLLAKYVKIRVEEPEDEAE